MMVSATEVQARVSGNILAFIGTKLRGSGSRAYGFGLGVRTGERTVRLPSGSVYRYDPAGEGTRQLLGDPIVVVEVCSPSNLCLKHAIKLDEYRALSGVREIVLIDPLTERVRFVSHAGDQLLEPGGDLVLSSIGVSVPHAEIFARD